MSLRAKTHLALLTLLLIQVLFCTAKANPVFNYGPISEPILSASFSANFAALTANPTVFGTQVNHVQLKALGLPALDLSDDFFGTAAFPTPPAINMGTLQTGVVSVAIPSSFFPALTSGLIGYDLLFTDTDDGLFALGSISLNIQTATSSIESIIGPNDGFGLGIPTGGTLPAPLPISILFGATGTGFDETIASKALQASIPEPGSIFLLVAGLLVLTYRKRKALIVIIFGLMTMGPFANAQLTCPPLNIRNPNPPPATILPPDKAVPGKPGERGWLLDDKEVDANGNKLELWCLKANADHGGPDAAWLWKPAGAKDEDAVWIGACTFPQGRNKPSKNFTKTNDGKPKQFTTLTWLNTEKPPDGTNDWDYSFDTSTGKLTLSKTKGAWFDVIDVQTGLFVGRVYITQNVVGSDTYPAPKNFKDIKFTSGGTTTQVTQLFPGPDNLSAEAFALIPSVNGTNWSYTLQTNSQGGSGTAADPYIGTLANLQIGDTITISGIGIQHPVVSSPASQPQYGGWVVDSFSSTYVTFRATSATTFIPGFAIPGFGFTSTASAGKVFWNLHSSNETIGSSGIVTGPAASPDQLHLTGPSPNRISTGQSGTIQASLQANSVGIPGATVTFTKLAGNFTFTDGTISSGGNTSSVETDGNGNVRMSFTAQSSGVGFVQVSAPGTSLRAYSLFFVQ